MANVIPFRAVRPTRDKVHLVASRAFYTYQKHVLEAKLDSNPYSFIHIINPEFREVVKTKPNSVERFIKVRNRYQDFKDRGVLIGESAPAYYIYRQTGEDDFCGIIGGASAEDYRSDVIKKHEQTLTQREQVFKTYLDVCEFNAEPVLLTHPDSAELDAVMEQCMSVRPEYEFTTTDEITHSLWVVDNKEDIQAIQHAFEKLEALYIADGHHRSASSALLANERLQSGASESGNDQFFMAYLIPERSLKIYDFNRLITDLNGLELSEFIEKIRTSFVVEESDLPVVPDGYNVFGLFVDSQWFKLTFRGQVDAEDPACSLDTQILSDYLLAPILDITDLKTSDRIHFSGGPTGFAEMVRLVEQGKYRAAFSLYPVTTSQLKAVADHGSTMPPKSTWIEPKLRSGLTIYEL